VPNANKSRHSQWFKYPEDQSTWEDEKHLLTAARLVNTFWSDLNLKKSDLVSGAIYASERYIGESFIVLKFHTIIKYLCDATQSNTRCPSFKMRPCSDEDLLEAPINSNLA
jgi:hypothetical protein